MPNRYLRLLTVLVFIIFTACKPIGAPEATVTSVSTTVTEQVLEPINVYGVNIESKVKSAVCLSPAIVEILYEIRYDDMLIGVGDYCDYPTQAMTEKKDCGSAANPDIDTIISLAPEVLITQSPIANKDVTLLKNAGIAYMLIPATDSISQLEELYINLLYGLRGPSSSDVAASIAVPGLDELRDDIKNADVDLGKFVYYIEDGFIAAGDDTFPGNFFSSFGTNLCDGKTAVLPLDTGGDGEDGEGNEDDSAGEDGADGNSEDDSEGEDSEDGATQSEPRKIRPDTVILPASLTHLIAGFDGGIRVIILSPEATSLLERPTDRVRYVIQELGANPAETTEE
jgi:ABC-type hemin transport system substrate-binding protein